MRHVRFFRRPATPEDVKSDNELLLFASAEDKKLRTVDYDGDVRELSYVNPDSAIVYGHAVYVQYEPDDITVPAGGGSEYIKFNTKFVEEGVDGYSSAGNHLGFYLSKGIWHLSAQAHWGGGSSTVEKWAWLSGLPFSHVEGSIDMDMESSDVIPVGSNAYVNKISTIFEQSEPSASVIVGLGVNQSSASVKHLGSAVLTCVKLRGL